MKETIIVTALLLLLTAFVIGALVAAEFIEAFRHPPYEDVDEDA